jgi:3-oxoacyl-[acyl-carrier protein] reductase
MKRFESKNILITGGNAGIGLETARLFTEEGAHVCVLDIAAEASETLKLFGRNVTYFKCDVSKSLEVKAAFEKAIATVGQLHAVVNNAGILGPRTKTEDYPEADFDAVISVNVNGVYYCMKEAIRHFNAVGGGAIINTASVAGKVGMSKHLAYSASKHAVLGMTKTAAIEVAKKGIRINAVCPGFTETAMLESANTDPQHKEMLRFATPMKRFGKPSEISSVILFLASDESSYMTGQGIVVDGGLTIQ